MIVPLSASAFLRKTHNTMDTKELIHQGYLAWDEENISGECTDEELFAAGANFIINYLILHDKL